MLKNTHTHTCWRGLIGQESLAENGWLDLHEKGKEVEKEGWRARVRKSGKWITIKRGGVVSILLKSNKKKKIAENPFTWMHV